MKTLHPIAALLLAFAPLATQAARSDLPPLTSGVNDVQFDGTAEQPFLGSGFVIAYAGRYFGVTAKHVLLMRQGGPPASTDIEAQLDHWRLRDPRSKTTLTFGRLLNGDSEEPVNMDVLQRDALIFELADPGPFKPLALAAREPEAGDPLRAIGCAYATEQTCAQDSYAGTYLDRLGPSLLIDLGAQPMDKLMGLSGAPVLNDAGEVVGIVSNQLNDASGTPRFAPVDIRYLRAVLDKASARS